MRRGLGAGRIAWPTPTCRVLITGESGVGKDVVAPRESTPALVARAARCFIKLNCGRAWPSELLESEPVRSRARAASPAAEPHKAGAVRSWPTGGTLFLDEIGEIAGAHPRPKLLQVLQDGEFYRVGGQKKLGGRRTGDRRHQRGAAGRRVAGRTLSRGSLLPGSNVVRDGDPGRCAAARAATICRSWSTTSSPSTAKRYKTAPPGAPCRPS